MEKYNHVKRILEKLKEGLYVHIEDGYFYYTKNGEYVLRTNNGGKFKMSESVVCDYLLKHEKIN